MQSADDLVVIPENKDDLIKRLNAWKDDVEIRGMGMRVNMNKSCGTVRHIRSGKNTCWK